MSCGDLDLPLDEVEAGDEFGNRVLNLETGVHFEKVVGAGVGVYDKFDGAGVGVAYGLRGGDGGGPHFRPEGLIEQRGRGFFDDFLMAALDGTFALVEVEGVPVLVGEDLDFDVAGFGEVFFEDQPVVAKRVEGFAPGRGERFGQVSRRLGDPHAFAPPARGGFDQDRVANPRGFGGQGGFGLIIPLITGHDGHSGFLHEGAGVGFVAHCFNGGGRRADESQPCVGNGLGKGGVFRQKAITGVNGLCARRFC